MIDEWEKARGEGRLAIVAAIVGAIVLFAIVSTLDYRDAKQEQSTYCRNVAQGVWPAYRRDTRSLCPGYKKRRGHNRGL